MNSRSVTNLFKISGSIKPRLWDGRIQEAMKTSPDGGTVSTFVTRRQQLGTDYVPPTDLSRVPLKTREQYSRTRWPADNRSLPSSVAPASRNYGCVVWRRYPNGQLDFRAALSMIVEALRRYKDSPALNEIDALVLASSLPGFNFVGLPKEIVDKKAFLTNQERRNLQEMLEENASDDVIRDLVDLAGP